MNSFNKIKYSEHLFSINLVRQLDLFFSPLYSSSNILDNSSIDKIGLFFMGSAFEVQLLESMRFGFIDRVRFRDVNYAPRILINCIIYRGKR